MPPGRRWPRLGIRPGVRFGRPLDFAHYSGVESEPVDLRAVTDEIMLAMRDLSEQEYVDEYAPRAKRRGRSLRGRPPADEQVERRAEAERPEVSPGSDT